jgi:hypothetical protein
MIRSGEDPREVRACSDTIGQAVVAHEGNGLVAVGETINKGHRPEGMAAIKTALGQAGDEPVELSVTSRSRQHGMPQVVGEVKIRILEVHRMVQTERHPLDPPAKRWELTQPVSHVLVEILHGDGHWRTVRRRRRLHHRHEHQVHRLDSELLV